MSGWFGGGGEHFSKVVKEGEIKMSEEGLVQMLNTDLPQRHAIYAIFYASAAQEFADGITLTSLDFAYILAGIIDRESYAGYYLKPRGPAGTGDPTPRWFDPENIPTAIQEVADEFNLYTGKTRVNDDGIQQVEIKPPAWANAQVAGWGYGLGQVDFASWKQWLLENNWQDPSVNIRKAAEIFSSYLGELGSIRHAVAAYNAGVSRIKKLADGVDPDIRTTGKDYSKDVIARASQFGLSRQV